MKNVNARTAKNIYMALSELGTRFNLSFSSQLQFSNKIIALDGLKRCLLVLETDKVTNQPYIIDLNKVTAVTVKKTYGSIQEGELKNRGIEDFLKNIDLHFESTNSPDSISLSFYDREIDEQKDRPKLDRNAKNWQMILSKIIDPQTQKEGHKPGKLRLAS